MRGRRRRRGGLLLLGANEELVGRKVLHGWEAEVAMSRAFRMGWDRDRDGSEDTPGGMLSSIDF